VEGKRLADGSKRVEVSAAVGVDPGGHREKRGIVPLSLNGVLRLREGLLLETGGVELGDARLEGDALDRQGLAEIDAAPGFLDGRERRPLLLDLGEVLERAAAVVSVLISEEHLTVERLGAVEPARLLVGPPGPVDELRGLLAPRPLAGRLLPAEARIGVAAGAEVVPENVPLRLEDVFARGKLGENPPVVTEGLLALVLVLVAPGQAQEHLLGPEAPGIPIEELLRSREIDGLLPEPPGNFSKVEERFGNQVFAPDFLQRLGRRGELAPMVVADPHLEAHELFVPDGGGPGAVGDEIGKRLVGVAVPFFRHQELGALQAESVEPLGFDRGKLRPRDVELSPRSGGARMPRKLVIESLENDHRLRVLLRFEEERSELVESVPTKCRIPALGDRPKHRNRLVAISTAPSKPGESEPCFVEDRDVAIVALDLLKELEGLVGTARLDLAGGEQVCVRRKLGRFDRGRLEEIDRFAAPVIPGQEHGGGERGETSLGLGTSDVLVDALERLETLPEIRASDAREGGLQIAEILRRAEHGLPGERPGARGLAFGCATPDGHRHERYRNCEE
jgi:hypothetical protein